MINKVQSIFILLIINVSLIACQEVCTTNDDCNNKGLCNENHECECEWFFQGKTCESKWEVNKGWEELWITFRVYTSLAHLILMCLIGYQLKLQGLNRNVVTLVLCFLLGGSLSTIIYF